MLEVEKHLTKEIHKLVIGKDDFTYYLVVYFKDGEEEYSHVIETWNKVEPTYLRTEMAWQRFLNSIIFYELSRPGLVNKVN